MIIGDNYITYLNNLKKDELINIINDYNNLREIYGGIKIETKNAKKDKLIDDITEIQNTYIKYVISSR